MARNKMRSALTMLGVFIGVAALITMVAVGEGAKEAVGKQIESLGTNVVVVLPGATTTGGVRAGFGSASHAHGRGRRRRSDGRMRRSLRSAISSASRARSSTAIRIGLTTLQGVNANYPSITNWRIAAGRGNDAGRREQGEPRRRPRTDSLPPALRRLCEPNRRNDPDQGRANAGDRLAS